jgi:hypothetical protein
MAIPNVITYGYIRGRWYAFPDSTSAYEGVTRYNGNTQSLRYSKPVGAIIDDKTLINTGFWPDTLADAPGVTGDALVEPPYNPITRNVTEEVDGTTTGGGGGGGGSNLSQDYNLPPDPGVAGRRSTGVFISGTNILQSEVNANLKANSGDAQYWEERLAKSDNPNDVLFEMTYRMGGGGTAQGQGQGNPWVGRLQAGQYKMTEGSSWAQDHTVAGGRSGSGFTDVYVQRDATGKPIGVQEGPEWRTQFEEGKWNPGDFSKTQRQKDDASIWKTKHDLNAQQTLEGDALTTKLTEIQNRYNRMLSA